MTELCRPNGTMREEWYAYLMLNENTFLVVGMISILLLIVLTMPQEQNRQWYLLVIRGLSCLTLWNKQQSLCLMTKRIIRRQLRVILLPSQGRRIGKGTGWDENDNWEIEGPKK